MEIELAVRIYPKLTRSPVMKGTKFQNVTRCLTSLHAALVGQNYKINFILDKCPLSYTRMIRDIFGHDERIIIHNVQYGNGYETFSSQIDILSKSNADVVGLIEDDYFFEPHCFNNLSRLKNILDQNTFYTLFNSSDYQNHKYHHENIIHENISGIQLLNVGSTTLSFFCNPSALRYYISVFKTYSNGNSDYPMWLLITRRWHNLFRIKNIFNYYDVSKIFKLIYNCRHLLKKKGRILVANPGLAVHLEPDGFSNDHTLTCFH